MATPWLPSYLITALLEREAPPVGGFRGRRDLSRRAREIINARCAIQAIKAASRSLSACEKATGRDVGGPRSCRHTGMIESASERLRKAPIPRSLQPWIRL
jgi:hypothetical protein